jgi:hypothetical protein
MIFLTVSNGILGSSYLEETSVTNFRNPLKIPGSITSTQQLTDRHLVFLKNEWQNISSESVKSQLFLLQITRETSQNQSCFEALLIYLGILQWTLLINRRKYGRLAH